MIDSSILVRKISRLRGRILSAAFFRVVFITFQTRKQSAAWNSSSSISHEIRREDTRQSVKWNSARFDNWTWTRYLRRISSQVNMCSTFTLNWAFIAWLSVAYLMLFLRRFRSSPPPKRPYLSSVQRLMLTRERIRLSDLLDRQAINPKPADCFEF